MTSAKTGVLNLPLTRGALDCHLFEGIKEPLISIGVLCDNGLTVTFDAQSVHIIDKNNTVVLTGRRDHRKMYMLPMTQDNIALGSSMQSQPVTTPASANATIYSLVSTARTVAQRVEFLSQTFGNPADSTLLTAAESTHLKSVPNITVDNIRQFAPDSIHTAKGHLDQSRQGTWSTSTSKRHKRQQRDRITRLPHASQTHTGHAMIVQMLDNNQLHGDLTGPYPTISHNGNTKVLIAYSEHGNFIKSVAVKGDSADDLITGYNAVLQFVNAKLAGKGIISDVIRLDNQTSAALETYFRDVAKVSFKFEAFEYSSYVAFH
jgi:hypothetical protein